jgi:hypothetical protein
MTSAIVPVGLRLRTRAQWMGRRVCGCDRIDDCNDKQMNQGELLWFD